MRQFQLILIASFASLAAVDSPITGGYGSDGPYAGGSVVTYTIANPIDVGTTLKPIRVYVSSTAPAGPLPVFAISHAFGADLYMIAENDYLPTVYPDLVRWAIGKGWSVIFVPFPASGLSVVARYDVIWSGFQTAAADAAAGPRLDTSKLCVWGHSFGAGAAPWLAWQASHEFGWGSNGLCVMSCAPWFMYRMPSERLGQLPAGMDLLLQVYDQDTVNDHQMAIQIYSTAALPSANKDYVLISGDSYAPAPHSTPSSSGPNGAVLDDLDWYGVFRMVDAMTDHVWQGTESGRLVALGHGSTEQQSMPAPTTLTSLWDNPVPRQPAGAIGFAWTDRDFWQPLPRVTLGDVPATVLQGTSVTLSADASTPAPGYASVYAVTFSSGSDIIATDKSAPYEYPWTPSLAGLVDVTVTVEDTNGRIATDSKTIEVFPLPANNPPTVAYPPVDQTGIVNLTFSYILSSNTFVDPDGDALTYSASGVPDGVAFDPPSLTFSGIPSIVGSNLVTITANDGNGGQASATLTITIISSGNHAPTVANPPPAQAGTTGAPFEYVLPPNTFADADGDTLTYSATDLPLGIAFDVLTQTFSGTPSTAGTNWVVITANDGRGGQVSADLVITATAGSAGGTSSDGGSSSGCGAGASSVVGFLMAWVLLGLGWHRRD